MAHSAVLPYLQDFAHARMTIDASCGLYRSRTFDMFVDHCKRHERPLHVRAFSSNSPYPANMAPKLFLNIQQGHGDVLTFPHAILPEYEASFAVDAVGTHGCRTCVCVYYPLSDRTCFIAHIDAHMGFSLGGPATTDVFVCEDEAAAISLKEKVKAKLTNTLRGHEAALQNQVHRSKAILICPCQNISGRPSTGAYVVDALCEFLHLDKVAMQTQDAHGFIINPVTGDVRYLRWDWNGNTKPSERDVDGDDFDENFPEERPGKYGWTEFDHTNEREWTALRSRGEWVWADPMKAIGPVGL
ncbi:hypothetical protein DOTSEDRAFT_34820 [Dothistroma septosporum NZE10]|uniref:Uncharacterized protein n=1 Tax=Dothistroma septosporum (strain NZE10 / CBS 128990) TaxID=675120 RepID=N1PLI2_DOTSN|nr:hypothetical protein DOTSEDRAFT_34820 [Dothistroma septosporum NZE10]